MLRFDECLKQIYDSKITRQIELVWCYLAIDWCNLTNHIKTSQIMPNCTWKCLNSFLDLSFIKVSLVRALKNVGSQFGRWNATISHFMKCLTPPFFRSWDDAFQSHSQRKQPFRMYMWSLSILLRNKVKSRERISHDFPYIFSIWGFSRFLFSFLGKGKSLIMRQHFRHENSKPSLPT